MGRVNGCLAFDLNRLSAGATECFEHIGAGTIQCVNAEYAQKRIRFKKFKLKWRTSSGSRRSLGWIPFQPANIKRKGNAIRFRGKSFPVYQAERLDDVKFRQGCFSQDACGTWWFCVAVSVEVSEEPAPEWVVGIDLGVKTAAVTSDGDHLKGGHYRTSEDKLAQAQRRGHKKQAKLISRKIKNRRDHEMHEFTRKVVNKYQNIFIGDVSSTKMAKTRMAKGALDASWGKLKAQLLYKGHQSGRHVEVIDERFTTRACSQCGSLSGPQGLGALGVRHWQCSDCGTEHDRDQNAARNIANVGLMRIASVCGNVSSSATIAENGIQQVEV